MAETAQARQKPERPASGATGPGGAAATAGAGLIDGAFAVDLARKLPQHGAGLAAFAVRDIKGTRDNLMAVQVRRGQPPRARVLAALQDAGLSGIAAPLAHGIAPGPDGVPAYFIVCPTPPGRPVGSGEQIWRSWTEAELLGCVLRPVAARLAELSAFGVTHRAIRPDNVFQTAPDQKATLGEAWAAPPASLQPAAFEAPYVGICPRGARGDGGIAEDIYALGVLLVALATGAPPMAGLEEAEIVRRKLAAGSFAALVGERYLPPTIADLVRGMLAEDPEHRPSPAQLDDPATARSRRVAARPVRLAQRPLEVAGHPVLTTRALAGAMAGAPVQAAALLRDGQVDRWLRRGLGDTAAAARIEEAVRLRGESGPEDSTADALLVARVIAVLDPLMPICWRGLPFWPDGLGPALVEAEGGALGDLRQAIAAEAIAAWATMRPERCDAAALRVEARQHRAILARRGWLGGTAALRYMLNPLTHCTSRALGRNLVVRVHDLLPALEQEAARGEPWSGPGGGPVDAEMAAFIIARQDLRLEHEFGILADPRSADSTEPGTVALAQVQVLARVQERVQAPPVPALAISLAAALRPVFVVWQSRSRRRDLEAALDERAASGRLDRLLDLLDNPPLRAQDEREAAQARTTLSQIDATLTALRTQRERHVDGVRRISQEAAAAVGLIAASVMALWLAL